MEKEATKEEMNAGDRGGKGEDSNRQIEQMVMSKEFEKVSLITFRSIESIPFDGAPQGLVADPNAPFNSIIF